MQRQTFIGFLLNAFNIFPVSQTELKDSLYNDGDYEDNVLIEVAKSNGIDAIITNNCRDFKSKEIKILSPEDVMGQ